MDIKGQHLTKQIVTKCSRWNIIMNLHGTNISKAKEWCNGDDDNDININDDGNEAPNHNNHHEP
jgi:hypothetical protein